MSTDGSPALSGCHNGRNNWSPQQEPQPQPPCFPAYGETGLLPPGTEVEVRLDGKGYYGIWFEATVTDFASTSSRNAPAQYSVTFGGDGDIRQFALTHVRPRPPALESPAYFRSHDIVEINHGGGWWSGLVLNADDRSVTVAFPITREVISYMPRLVRPKRDYVDGDWVPSQTVITIRPNHEIRRYEVGDEVEVVRKRGAYGHSWFHAKVAKVVDEFSYIVEYSGQNEEEGCSSEYLHWQFIRPAVQDLPPESEFPLHRLGPGAAVEAYCDGAWSAARVCRIPEDGKFVVRIKGKKGKQLMTTEVKPLYNWNGKDWNNIVSAKKQANFKQPLGSGERQKSQVEVPFHGDEHIHGTENASAKRSRKAQKKLPVLVQNSENASVSKMGTPLTASEIFLASTCPPNSCSPLHGHSTHPKFVMSDNVQNPLERKKPLVRKACISKKKLSKKNEDFEGQHSLHGPLELSSTGQNIAVNEIAGPQREPSLVFDRSESTQQQLTSENAVNAKAVKNQAPLGVVPLNFASTSDDIGKFSDVLSAQDNRITDVLRNNSHTQAPSFSCLLSAVEDMDVFKEFPQQPHFLPLQQYPETMHKGLKFGFKMVFNDCVEKIRKSSIADNHDSFEDLKSTLAVLRKHGFDIQKVECLLDKLIHVKDEYNKHLDEKSAVQTQKQQAKNSSDRKDLLLTENDKDIGELEMKLGSLRQKGQLIEKEKELDDENVSRLDVMERTIEEALDDDVRKFNCILAEGQ